MTVKELIELLEQYEPDCVVVSSSEAAATYGCSPVQETKTNSMYYDGSAYDNDSCGGEREATKVVILS